MVTSITRWGNSLGIRIPKAYAQQVDLTENTEVEISVENDAIVVRRPKREWTIRELVDGITPRNKHREAVWGSRAGRESW
ncbi:MAG: AbrB/MazE/SpoVT family DNA-binding domain-containing protein [Gemmatimonadaceae bacterium]